MNKLIFVLLALLAAGCCPSGDKNLPGGSPAPFVWEGANVYFLLTDRFCNGDPANDLNFGRDMPTAVLRGFMGGDLKGITAKLLDGYFSDLGINAIWFSPVSEQGHGLVNEGTGDTYGFHGYWTRDWTALEPNFGTGRDLLELVETAHSKGIRVILDVVLNHTGPVTGKDPVWPAEWVRTEPRCAFRDYASTVTCTLVDNLPDIRTESTEEVQLPPFLIEKWTAEGRLEKETAELDEFFAKTGYPRAPKYYIIKWLTDLIRDYGVDGFRIDTAKHVEESVWAELREQADRAFAGWKENNPGKVLDDNEFYLVGEVYNYNISSATGFHFGDSTVNYFEHGMDALINFELKNDRTSGYEEVFSRYSGLLNNELKGYSVLNFMSSHDDGNPYDKYRERPLEAGTRLLLCPGAAQVYYGDELARSLDIPGTQGDATLRSFMNWDELDNNVTRAGVPLNEILAHWQKLGRFRRAHPAVGAGFHRMLSASPYYFTRTCARDDYTDRVLVGLDLPRGRKEIEVQGVFPDGEKLRDYYSGTEVKVRSGKIILDTEHSIVLLGH